MIDDKRATVSVEDAARILGISRGLAYQMVHEGKLPCLRFGKRMVVPKKALDHLLEEIEIASSSSNLGG